MFGCNRSKKYRNIQDLTVCIQEVQLEGVESFKYLGVIIHQHMTWADHIDEIKLLPLEARQTLYMSLVAPLFDYADIVWGDKNNDTLITNLQRLF